mmetsp:Transcript_97356/g.271860  ORF Transcript_97356/g.271860 Transcript_97356/m.271860 type:complete len:253 (+) Transcript_97356:285-1043(+)
MREGVSIRVRQALGDRRVGMDAHPLDVAREARAVGADEDLRESADHLLHRAHELEKPLGGVQLLVRGQHPARGSREEVWPHHQLDAVALGEAVELSLAVGGHVHRRGVGDERPPILVDLIRRALRLLLREVAVPGVEGHVVEHSEVKHGLLGDVESVRVPHEAMAQQPPVCLRQLWAQLIDGPALQPPLAKSESIPRAAVHEDKFVSERFIIREANIVLLEMNPSQRFLCFDPGLMPLHAGLGLELLHCQCR